MADSVFVSGGSGYIAGFLIRQLVAEGWTVHTSVRSLAREAAVRQVLEVDDSRLKFFAATSTPMPAGPKRWPAAATWPIWPRRCRPGCPAVPTS